MMNPLRSKVLPGAKGVKNPDFRIDGQYVEIKRVRSGKDRAIKKRLDEAANQANHIIINIPEKYKKRNLRKTIEKKFNKYPELHTIEVRYNGDTTQHLRSDYLK